MGKRTEKPWGKEAPWEEEAKNHGKKKRVERKNRVEGKRMRGNKQILRMKLIFAALAWVALHPCPVSAASASVTFGSNWYNWERDKTFPVGVYIRSDSGTGAYEVSIRYNPLRLGYVSGADGADEENGILTLSGEEGGREKKYWLQFEVLSGGGTELAVESARIYVRGQEELYEVTTLGTAPVYAEGEDTAARAEREAELARQEAERAEREAQRQEESSPEETERQNTTESAPVTAEQERQTPILYNMYVAIVAAALGLTALTEGVLWLVIKRVRGGRHGKEKPPKDPEEESWAQTEDGLEIIEIDAPADRELQAFRQRLGREIASIVKKDGAESGEEKGREEEKGGEEGETVIAVKDVTMEFHLSSVNPSGLKEYVIQLLKREVSYRKLYALYHVSFNVCRGEILGIIGTNGSGKSTLLKIISGALKPTQGSVEVDRKKIQLLTLGTGFDMELTARENVFLNGAIIGYDKAFLEEHYDGIVAFAELQDFMEEKVKNFSSGMISRLGFAIATAGEAAEILILDEVLSVGDEFFRRKSMERIKEMIHGGSTVLMVSHGMGTILENCTKCAWIEKGELRMIGEPKTVCGAYRKMNEKARQEGER